MPTGGGGALEDEADVHALGVLAALGGALDALADPEPARLGPPVPVTGVAAPVEGAAVVKPDRARFEAG